MRELIESIRSLPKGSPERDKHFEALIRTAKRRVRRWHAAILKKDQVEEIVVQALLESYDQIDDSPSVDQAVKVLERALERIKKAYTRRLLRERGILCSIRDHEFLIWTDEATPDFELQKEHWFRVLKVISGMLRIALNQLRDRDHDLLVERYSLDQVGIKRRGNSLHLFDGRPKETKDRAARRARERFRMRLRKAIKRALNQSASDRAVLVDALMIIDGYPLHGILAAENPGDFVLDSGEASPVSGNEKDDQKTA